MASEASPLLYKCNVVDRCSKAAEAIKDLGNAAAGQTELLRFICGTMDAAGFSSSRIEDYGISLRNCCKELISFMRSGNRTFCRMHRQLLIAHGRLVPPSSEPSGLHRAYTIYRSTRYQEFGLAREANCRLASATDRAGLGITDQVN